MLYNCSDQLYVFIVFMVLLSSSQAIVSSPFSLVKDLFYRHFLLSWTCSIVILTCQGLL